jgi:hypothetical protein
MKRQKKIYEKTSIFVRFQALNAASVKMTAFSDKAPSRLVKIDRRFRGAYCLHQCPKPQRAKAQCMK